MYTTLLRLKCFARVARRRSWTAGLLLAATFSLTAHAEAPERPGQPYAEPDKCSAPEVIFCEDFNYPENFYFSGELANNNHRWINPGWAQESTRALAFGRQINATSEYGTKPQGSMPSGSQPDHVWAANWDPDKGRQGSSASPGRLRVPGGSYVNGLPPAKDFYVRMQVYWTPDYAWPGAPRIDKYLYSGRCIDNKILFVYPSEGLKNPTGASYDAGPYTACGAWEPTNNARFSDALIFRVGTTSDGYKSFPMDSNASSNPKHMEYAPYRSLTLRNPDDTPTFGNIFRFNVDRWYTLEFRYKLSDSGQNNGTIEAWIDGTKIYSANDLETCAKTDWGDCSGLGALILMAYHNRVDETVWDGQQIVDNLVISTAYVGPPGESTVGTGADSTAPAAPSVLRIE